MSYNIDGNNMKNKMSSDLVKDTTWCNFKVPTNLYTQFKIIASTDKVHVNKAILALIEEHVEKNKAKVKHYLGIKGEG